MNEYTEKDIIQTQRETIDTLRAENTRLEQSAIHYVEEYYELACAVQTMSMKLDRALREIHELKVQGEYNTASCKKFEAGYWQKVGE